MALEGALRNWSRSALEVCRLFLTHMSMAGKRGCCLDAVEALEDWNRKEILT